MARPPPGPDKRFSPAGVDLRCSPAVAVRAPHGSHGGSTSFRSAVPPTLIGRTSLLYNRLQVASRREGRQSGAAAAGDATAYLRVAFITEPSGYGGKNILWESMGMRWKDLIGVVRETASGWFAGPTFQYGAALAFYGVFALAPTLV